MSGENFRRAAAVSAQAAVLIVTLGCEAGPTPTAPTGAQETITVPPQETSTVPSPAPGPVGGRITVTINGEARPGVYVELRRFGGQWGLGTTIPSGSWELETVPFGDYDVVIKTPPGLTCDATRKSVTVGPGQPMLVDFACLGDVKGSIVGFASAEFGTVASARISLTGPVNRETLSNRDGFFAFENLPPGEYLLRWCKDPVRASARDGATVFATVDCS